MKNNELRNRNQPNRYVDQSDIDQEDGSYPGYGQLVEES
ncbi:hypothetical protein ACVLD2_000009 [Paenibacillus sp. PvR052]